MAKEAEEKENNGVMKDGGVVIVFPKDFVHAFT